VNPSTPAFDKIPDDEPVTFMPLETVWADSRVDTSRCRPKSEVSTGYVRFVNGDILSPKVTPTFQAGRSALITTMTTPAGAASTEVHVVRARPGLADPRFVRYGLLTKPFLEEGVSRFQGVAGLQRVPDEFLRDLALRAVDIDGQRRIADFLDDQVARIDNIVAARSRQKEAIDEEDLASMADALSGGCRDQGGAETGWEWLPRVPATWGVAPVFAFYDAQLGKMLNPERAAGAHPRPYLRNANVHWFDIDVTDVAIMSFEPGERVRYQVLPGDLLVCEGGAGVAEAAVWRGQIEECYFQKSLHRVRPRGHLPAEWIMYWLRLAKASGVFESDGNLATIPHLTGEQLREYRIPVPPPEAVPLAALQVSLDTNARLRSLVRESVARLEELKRSLITAAVTGQFDVSTADGSKIPS
jgi:type I restriction enzyme S subunit